MERKTFMFVLEWMEPLRTLDAKQSWNVMEAIAEYAATGKNTRTFSAVENMAFMFIRAEIDRMQSRYNEVCDKRRDAANARWSRKNSSSDTPAADIADDDGECKCTGRDANDYDTKKENDKGNEKQGRRSRAKKKPAPLASPSSEVVVGNAPEAKAHERKQPEQAAYDDSTLLESFFDSANNRNIEALAARHHLTVEDIRRMAEDVVMHWALIGKTHSDYQDAASHLVYAIGDQAQRERRQQLKEIGFGDYHTLSQKGVLGIDEYIDGQGRRTYNGVDIIPHDAPPRPGKAFYWNETTNSWDDIL